MNLEARQLKKVSAEDASAQDASAQEASAQEVSAQEPSAAEPSAEEASFVEVALLEELAPEEPLRVVVEGASLLLVRLQGEVFAIASTCTHEREDLDAGFIEEGCIECPRHGARFDLRTGAALTLPATRGLATYPVRIQDGRVLVAAQANPSLERT